MKDSYKGEYDKRNIEYYESQTKEWAEFDARRVVGDGDTIGKWAEYRLGIITGYKNRLFVRQPELMEKLYAKYLDLLNKEIKKLDGNKVFRRYGGNVPAFTLDANKRKKQSKITIEL